MTEYQARKAGYITVSDYVGRSGVRADRVHELIAADMLQSTLMQIDGRWCSMVRD
jgi:hypothetical protein